jgi:hypothetical protein
VSIPVQCAVVVRIESIGIPGIRWWALVDQKRVTEYRPETTMSHAIYQFHHAQFVHILPGVTPYDRFEEVILMLRRDGQIFLYEKWPSLRENRRH